MFSKTFVDKPKHLGVKPKNTNITIDQITFESVINGSNDHSHIQAELIDHSLIKNNPLRYFCILNNLRDGTTYVPYSRKVVPYINYLFTMFNYQIPQLDMNAFNHMMNDKYVLVHELLKKSMAIKANQDAALTSAFIYGILKHEIVRNNVFCPQHNVRICSKKLMVVLDNTSKIVEVAIIDGEINATCDTCMSILLLKVAITTADNIFDFNMDDISGFYELYYNEIVAPTIPGTYNAAAYQLSFLFIQQLLSSFSSSLAMAVSFYADSISESMIDNRSIDIQLYYGMRLSKQVSNVDYAMNTKIITSALKATLPSVFSIKSVNYSRKADIAKCAEKNFEPTKKMIIEYLPNYAIDSVDISISNNVMYGAVYLQFIKVLFHNIFLSHGIKDMVMCHVNMSKPNCVDFSVKDYMPMIMINDRNEIRVDASSANVEIVRATTQRTNFLDVNIVYADTKHQTINGKECMKAISIKLAREIAMGTGYASMKEMNNENDKRITFRYTAGRFMRDRLDLNVSRLSNAAEYKAMRGLRTNIERLLKDVNVDSDLMAKVSLCWRCDGAETRKNFTICQII